MQRFLVGGAVRDALLGLPVVERDWVVVGADEQTMLAAGYLPLSGTFPVYAHPETGEEHALARREVKCGTGHRGFRIECGPDVTLPEDLRRRDFRINAIAEDPTGRLHDPYRGLDDLRQRRIRHVSPAFVEDPLRVLRCARFAARLAPLGFEIDATTRRLLTHMSSEPELVELSRERVWRETARAFAAGDGGHYLAVLWRIGALAALTGGTLLGAALTRLAPPRSLELDRAPPGSELGVTELGLVWVERLLAAAGVADRVRPEEACAVARRLGLPDADARQAGLVRTVARSLDVSPTPSADEVMAILEAIDALRRPERLQRVKSVLERAGGREPAIHGALARLMAGWGAARAVAAGPLAARGIRGAALGQALRAERVRAVGHALQNLVGEATPSAE